MQDNRAARTALPTVVTAPTTASPPTQSPPSVPVGSPPRFGPIFAVIAAGVAMSNLDLFIVNVALPDIGSHFDGSSLSSLSWILNAYAVVFAALLVPAGSLADRTSPRQAYLWGIGVFTLASALCAVAPNVWLLVAARVVQAAGAAVLMPSSLGLLLAAAPPQRRGSAVRAWTAISGLAAALGPVAGGLLTELDWRWVFLVNVPFGVAVLLAGPAVLPRTPARPSARRPDLVGAGVLTAAIALLALGLVRGEDWGWTSGQVLGSLIASVVLVVVFLYRSARHPAPILPLPLLRSPAFSAATFASLVFSVAFAAMLLSVVLWCQDVWGWSALRTGLGIAPGPLMVPALAVGAGPLAGRVGARVVAGAGCVIFGVGIAWWALMLDPDPAYARDLLPGMLLTGMGVGLALPTLISAAVTAVPPQNFSTGSAVSTMARQIGTVIGIAMFVAVLAAARDQDAAALLDAYDLGWLLTIIASALAAVACLIIPHRRPASSGA